MPSDTDLPPFAVNAANARTQLETAMFEASDMTSRFKNAVKSAANAAAIVGLATVTAPIWVPVATAAAVTAPVTIPMAYGALKLAEATSADLEKRAESNFRDANKGMIEALKQPMAGGLTTNLGVCNLLADHIKGSATDMSPKEAVEMAAMGEHICKALAEGRQVGPNGLEVNVPGKDNPVFVPAGNFAAKAVSWHLMAAAAQADLQRKQTDPGNLRSDMTNSGTFILKDPDNRLYNFLNANPMVLERASTHFEERLDHDKHIPLLGNTLQKGCDDYQNKFPGGGGALLFDKLKGGEIFVKFEHAGTPNPVAHEAGDGVRLRANRAALAAERWVEHSFSFLESLKATTGDPKKVVRQEHTYKGEMKNAVHDPYVKLVEAAKEAGLINKNEAKAMTSHAKSHGLPSIAAGIEIINEKQTRLDDPNTKVALATKTLVDNIDRKFASMGQANNELGIERRGGEVHLNANPYDYINNENEPIGVAPPQLPAVNYPRVDAPLDNPLLDRSIKPEDVEAIAAPFDARIRELQDRKEKLETPSIGDRLKALVKHGPAGVHAEIAKLEREIEVTSTARSFAVTDNRVEVQKYEVDKLKFQAGRVNEQLDHYQKAEATLNKAAELSSRFDYGLDVPLSDKESLKLAAEVGKAINVREALQPKVDELQKKKMDLKDEIKMAEKAVSVREKLGPKVPPPSTGGAGGYGV